MYGRNASHNRDASDMTEVAPPYTRVWKKPGHGVLEYPPSYVDGVLYLAADSGWVGAYHAQSGELIWSKRFPKVLNQPAYYRGRVYFGSYDRNIYALDARHRQGGLEEEHRRADGVAADARGRAALHGRP